MLFKLILFLIKSWTNVSIDINNTGYGQKQNMFEKIGM